MDGTGNKVFCVPCGAELRSLKTVGRYCPGIPERTMGETIKHGWEEEKSNIGPSKCWKAGIWCPPFAASATENKVSKNKLEILEPKVQSLNWNARPHIVYKVTAPPHG